MDKPEHRALGNGSIAAPREDGVPRDPQRIVDRLVAAFPGNLGYSVSLHFSPYLSNEEVNMKEQAEAYDEIMRYLDSFKIKVPFTLRVLDYYLASISGNKKEALKNREDVTTQWLLNATDEQLELYKKALLKRAEEQQGKRGRRGRIERANITLKNRLDDAGYYSRFIPLLRRLSPNYADHMDRLEALNNKICGELNLRYDDDGYLIVGS